MVFQAEWHQLLPSCFTLAAPAISCSGQHSVWKVKYRARAPGLTPSWPCHAAWLVPFICCVYCFCSVRTNHLTQNHRSRSLFFKAETVYSLRRVTSSTQVSSDLSEAQTVQHLCNHTQLAALLKQQQAEPVSTAFADKHDRRNYSSLAF